MALDKAGMQRMESPEIVAQANPDVVLVTDYGFDRLGGSVDQIKALPASRRRTPLRPAHLSRRGKST